MTDLAIVLGCFGFKVDNFISCVGTENNILKVNTSLTDYNGMMDYFDQCCLFDRPMFDINAIRHFVHNMQDRYDQVIKTLWSTKEFELYQKFIIDHKRCGLFIKLRLPVEKVPESDWTSSSLKELREYSKKIALASCKK